jgi:hypothetical protein
MSRIAAPELRNFEPFFEGNNQIKEFYRHVLKILCEFHLKKGTIIFSLLYTV